MIKEVKMFTVVCDNCGKDSNEGTEYSCWVDEEQAEEMASNSEWIKEADKHYCPDCFYYDEDDNLILLKNKLMTEEQIQKLAGGGSPNNLFTDDQINYVASIQNKQ